MKTIPRARMNPLRLFRELVANPVRLRTKLFAESGDIVSIKFGPTETILVSHPEHVGEMLGERETNFLYRAALVGETLAPISGTNVSVLLNNNLQRWQRDRRTLKMSVDDRGHFAAYTETIAERVGAHLEQWPRQYPARTEIDIEDEIDTMAVDIMLNTVFSHMDYGTERYKQTMAAVTRVINERSQSLNPLPWMLPSAARARYRDNIDQAVQMTRAVVRRRLDEGLDYDDVVGDLLHHNDAPDRETLVEDTAYQMNTLMSAGLFTTSTVVHWTMLLLSRFPEYERRMAAEIEEQLGDRPPRFEDLKALRFTHAFLQEVLRMYPVTLQAERRSAEDGELGGYRIPRKTDVIVSIYHVHRHPDFWDNPEGFDPGRFLDKPLGQDYPYAYVPFGGGRRSCVGRSYAVLKATIMVVMLVQRVRLHMLPNATIGYKFPTIVSMRPDVSRMKVHYKH